MGDERRTSCGEAVGGEVVNIKGSRYYVRVKNRPAACASCKACALFLKENSVIPARLSADCGEQPEAGDTVLVRPPKPRPVIAMLLLFAVPILTLFLGVLTAVLAKLPELAGILLAAGGLAVGFAVILVVDRLILSDRNRYEIEKTMKQKENVHD